jgi:hypothetical protein
MCNLSPTEADGSLVRKPMIVAVAGFGFGGECKGILSHRRETGRDGFGDAKKVVDMMKAVD